MSTRPEDIGRITARSRPRVPVRAVADTLTRTGQVVLADPEWVETVDSLVNSPFVRDTAFALTGELPLPIEARAHSLDAFVGRSVVLAYVDRNSGALGIRPYAAAQGPTKLENVVLHEAGHLREAQPMASARVERAVGQMYGKAKNLYPDSYATSSRSEHFAQTFAVALQTLRRIADDPREAHRVVEVVDRAWPGTARMIEWMLENPAFASHPLNHMRAPRGGILARLSAMVQGLQRMAGGNPAGFGKKRGHLEEPLRSGWTGNPVERDGPPGPREQAKKRQRETSKRGGA